MLGRPVCVELPAGQVAKVLEDHIHGKMSLRLPYSTHSMRKRARWPEIWKNRSCLADVLAATGGYQMKPTYATEEMAAAAAASETEGTADDIEKCGYRLRTMMCHLRDAKKNSWKPPAKYDAVRGLISIVRVEPPPLHRKSLQKAAKKAANKAVKKAAASRKPKRQLERNTSSTSHQSSDATSSLAPPSPLGALSPFKCQAAPVGGSDSEDIEEIPILKAAPPQINLELDLDTVIADLFAEPQPKKQEIQTVAVAETPQKPKKQEFQTVAVVETPEKPAASKPKKQEIQTVAVVEAPAKISIDYNAIAALLEGSDATMAPTASEYTQMFKKPAAARKKGKKKKSMKAKGKRRQKKLPQRKLWPRNLGR